MRTVIAKIACGILALSSGKLCASGPLFEQPPKNNLHLTGGYRQDELKWNIAGIDNFPSTFSKVKWKDLRIAEVTGWWDHSSPSNYYIRINGGYGRIMSGHGSVSNFADTDILSSSSESLSVDDIISSESSSASSNIEFESLRYSRQNFDGGRGYVYDFTGGIGWGVVSGGGRSRISALGGWSFHSQHLKAFDFKQTVDPFDLVGIGRIPGLNATYLANWSGPFVGVDLTAAVDCNITLFGGAEWHWARYRAKSHWKYTSLYDAHIRHHTQGYGVIGYFGFDWAPCDRWGFGLWGKYSQWSTAKGKNKAFVQFDNVDPDNDLPLTFPVVEDSRLRRVKWYSFSVSAVASYRW